MHGTVLLRLTDTPARGEIARHAVVAIAVKAGLLPPAADRAGIAVAGVVALCREGDVTVTAALDGGTAVVTIAGGGDAWCRESAVALEAFGAEADAGGVTLRLKRAPLHGL
jgi:hypothetical protein